MLKATTIQPINLKHFVNKPVLIRLQEGCEVRGILTVTNHSQHGSLGNLFITTKNGVVLVRGSAIQIVALLGGE